jgi:hypothetical protein
MSTRTVHPVSLPELGPDLDRAWRVWLTRHGLPTPDRICAGGPIVCDDDARTVSAWCKVQDERGIDVLNDDRTEVLKELVTVQLESPALPFPGGYTVMTDAR